MDDCLNWSQSSLGPHLDAVGPDITEELRDNRHQHRSAFAHAHKFKGSVLLHTISRQCNRGYGVLPTAIVCPRSTAQPPSVSPLTVMAKMLVRGTSVAGRPSPSSTR